MAYKRYDGFINSTPQKLIDTALPICPFCDDSPHWLLEVHNGTKIEVECMCEKCGAKVKMENRGFSYDKNLLITDVGKENKHRLNANSYYDIDELSKFTKNEQTSITNTSNNKKNTGNKSITIIVVALLFICMFALVGYFSGNKSEDETLPPSNEQVDNTSDEYRQTVENLRDDLYNIYKQYVYDQITSGMYYSDVQRLVDSATRQCKQSISTLNVQLDLSNGTYFPKWVATVRTNNSKTYALFYIEVQCTTSYKVTHKYIGKYNIT